MDYHLSKASIRQELHDAIYAHQQLRKAEARLAYAGEEEAIRRLAELPMPGGRAPRPARE